MPACGNRSRDRETRFQATANHSEGIQTDSALRNFVFGFALNLAVGRLEGVSGELSRKLAAGVASLRLRTTGTLGFPGMIQRREAWWPRVYHRSTGILDLQFGQ